MCRKSAGLDLGELLVGRYYDPATGQFLSVDPMVDETGQPYAYAGDDPVNASDPSGLATCAGWLGWVPGCGVVTDLQNAAAPAWRDVNDVPQDVDYLVYWGAYEGIKGIDQLGSHFGPVGCAIAGYVSAPLVPFEAGGLAGDAGFNILKGETIWQQGVGGQPLLGNEVLPGTNLGGKSLSNALGLPQMDFPGFRAKTHQINFLW